MLASEYRLTEASDFERVKLEGETIRSKNFILGFFDRKDATPTRFGFVIPTKVTKRATDRNRIKRVLGESTRHQLVFLRNGFDVVFIPSDSLLRAYAAEVMKEVKDAFEKAGMFR